ncbi:MAG: hypothetical protein H6743_03680, partial [Rickettsiaceae bacterium]|nr:hypothetical protein [Rickettsiaceae bacterium]
WNELFTSTEAMDDFKELGRLDTPDVLTLDEGYSVSITPVRYGAAISVSQEDMIRMGDNTEMIDTYLRRQRDQLLTSGFNKFLTSNFQMLNEAFSGSATYLAPDGNAFLGSHTWASGATFDNGVTEVFSSTAVDNAEEYAGAFTDGKGKPMPINLDTIIVKKGSAAARLAKKLFAEHIAPTAVADINIYEGEYTIIETPYITTANKLYWFMRASNLRNSLAVGIVKPISLDEPVIEKNGSVYTPATGFWKQGIVNMPFDWYGSTGS